MSRNEKEFEEAIIAKGKTHPRVTLARIDEVIDTVYYFTADNGVCGYMGLTDFDRHEALGLLTFCVIVLKNGFTVTGESACAHPQNFDRELGQQAAYEKARDKIWALEGYLLKQELHAIGEI